MRIRYDCKLMINLTTQMKEEANKKAMERGQNLSTYIRDLIVKDIEKK